MKPFIAALFFSVALFAMPASAYAANATFLGPIVPVECHCSDQKAPDGSPLATAPDYGCVLQVVQNSINFAVSIGVLLFVIYLTYTGFMLVVSGGSPGAREQGRTRLLNVVVGMAVLLGAWLMVDFVMKTLYNNDVHFGPWNAVLAGKSDKSDMCIVAKEPKSLTTGTLALLIAKPGGTSAGGGTGVSGGAGTSKMDTAKAVSYASSNAAGSSKGKCALYVRQALAAGGLTQFNNDHPASAYQYGPYLTKAGFSKIGGGTYSKNAEGLGGLQAGDVVVFDRVSGHPDGHIAIYTGSQWVSDYKQSTMSSNPSDYTGGAYSIYRP